MKDSCPSGAFRVSHCLIYKVQTALIGGTILVYQVCRCLSSTFSNFFCRPTRHTSVRFSCCHSHNVSQQTGHKKDSHMDCHPYVSALPIFPGRRQPSILGAGELNCRVRKGNGWTLTAISTDFVAVDFVSLASTYR